ncbi:collagen alpha-1(I) chain-like [Diceros bicornis minor]|uniref:collagen alpha-1(I) chain-like n=1 Tax=Diceros bicornis minor TaxID=77932 RepID=UPI0026EC7BAD|nr:collagen alpha-1(I) chain-like [Diceros bicornis minor]
MALLPCVAGQIWAPLSWIVASTSQLTPTFPCILPITMQSSQSTDLIMSHTPVQKPWSLPAGGGGRARAGLRGAPGAGGPCAGPRRQPGDPAQLAGQPEELGGRGARPPFFPLARPPSLSAVGEWARGPPARRPGARPPAPAPAEPRNFPGAGAKVSEKCCPSSRDGAAEPARGARRGTRAPPERRPQEAAPREAAADRRAQRQTSGPLLSTTVFAGFAKTQALTGPSLSVPQSLPLARLHLNLPGAPFASRCLVPPHTCGMRSSTTGPRSVCDMLPTRSWSP